MSDVYTYWRAALQGKAKSAPTVPTVGHGGGEDPQPGLWKVKLGKGKAWVPMQVWLVDHADQSALQWRDGLKLMGTVNGVPAPVMELCERWLFAHPVTKQEHAHWREHGFWPSDAPPLPERPNMPADQFEALKGEADDRIEQVRQWLTVNAPIQTQEDCDKATNMQRALLDLRKQGDDMHRAEKDPILKQERVVDTKYGFRAVLQDWADRLRTVFEQYLRAEERRQREAADKAFREEQARIEAEREAIEAEHARKVQHDPVAALTEPPPELPELPAGPEPVKVQSGGGFGVKAALKTAWDVEITDYKLTALHVIADPDVVGAVCTVIKRHVKAAKGKASIPGTTITSARRTVSDVKITAVGGA